MSEPETKAEEVVTRAKMVYLYPSIAYADVPTKRKLTFAWFVVANEETDDPEGEAAENDRLYFSAGKRDSHLGGIHASPGQVFNVHLTINETGGRSVYTAGDRAPTFSHVWHDVLKVAEWRARRDAVMQAWAAIKLMTADARRKYHLERLEPIRHAYHKLTGVQRSQLLALVVGYVTGGRPKE